MLVIALQPGGDASNAKDSEFRQPSGINEYLSESWTLAAELRKRFGRAYLEESIGTNAIYFRSPNWEQWLSVEHSLRTRLELFSIDQNKRLIQAMRPKKILLLGWDALKLMGGSSFRELVANRPENNRPRRKRLLQSGRIKGIPAFAIPHPSAAWKHPPVTDDDWQRIVAGIEAGV